MPSSNSHTPCVHNKEKMENDSLQGKGFQQKFGELIADGVEGKKSGKSSTPRALRSVFTFFTEKSKD